MGQVPVTKEMQEAVERIKYRGAKDSPSARSERIRGKLIRLGRPHYTWAARQVYECKRCGATSEVPMEKVELAKRTGEDISPVCHINKWHGHMAPCGKDYYMKMCSWID